MPNFFQRIGQIAFKVSGNSKAKILIYAELEDGVISCDLFAQHSTADSVRFCFASKELRSLVYEFWEVGADKIESKSWAGLEFLITDGSFNVELTYPNQFKLNESLVERRPRVIAKHFGNTKVDYSKPNGNAP